MQVSSIVEQTLAPELSAGEHILWCGQPSNRIIFHPSDLFGIPFSLLWGGFTCFWEWSALGEPSSLQSLQHARLDFSAFWGVPFLLVGQYMIWLRFFYTAWRKTRTFYALTDQRVLVLNTGRFSKRASSLLASIHAVSLTLRSNSFGTLEFKPDPGPESSGGWSSRRGGQKIDLDLTRLAFYDIPDARPIYNLLEQQRKKLLAATPPASPELIPAFLSERVPTFRSFS